MSTWRVLVVHAVIILLAAGSLYDIAVDKEHWPFSQYPMYSTIERENSLEQLQLFGVAQEEPYQEIHLHEYQYIYPFDRSRLHAAFARVLIKTQGNPEKRQQMLNEALLDRLKWYEKLRLAGLHDGPPLRGMRLYRSRWQLDAGAGNVDQPDYRELVAEVEQP